MDALTLPEVPVFAGPVASIDERYLDVDWSDATLRTVLPEYIGHRYLAIEAALTGHLVLTTLHTNDAPSTPPTLGGDGNRAVLGDVCCRLRTRPSLVEDLRRGATEQGMMDLRSDGLAKVALGQTIFREVARVIA